jgi:murein DD-endopeptidase MepM/ murein hydrolase activator NlpD
VNKNVQTGTPKTHGYPAYDFRATPDQYARSSIYGKVTQTKKTENRNWVANQSGDPYKPASGKRALRTEDYGNYVKIKGNIENETIYEITSHHKQNTLTVEVGQEVKPGQILAEIGTTGNSTGLHEHKEFRNAQNQAIEVEFVDEITQPTEPMDKKQQIIDAYLGTRPNLTPSDDEINARLQQNKNQVELIRDILGGDGNAKEYWLTHWNISQTDTNWQETARAYEDTFNRLKEIYSLTPADNTENVLGYAIRSVERIKELEKQQEPKTIYKVDGKDFENLFKIGNIRLIIEK